MLPSCDKALSIWCRPWTFPVSSLQSSFLELYRRDRVWHPLRLIHLRNKVIAGHSVHSIQDALLSSPGLMLLILNDRTDFKRHSPSVLCRDEAINRFTLAHREWHTHCFLPLSQTAHKYFFSLINTGNPSEYRFASVAVVGSERRAYEACRAFPLVFPWVGPHRHGAWSII